LGFEFLAFEADPDYYKAASERLAREMAQVRLWDYLEENQQKFYEMEESK